MVVAKNLAVIPSGVSVQTKRFRVPFEPFGLKSGILSKPFLEVRMIHGANYDLFEVD